MGKQLRFYMTDRDEDEFLDFVRSTGDVVFLPQTTDKEHDERFSTFREFEGRRLGESCHLWNRSISPQPIVNHYDVHGGCYCLDFLASEVVNVMRSKRVGRTLSMGRLHIEDQIRRPDGAVVKKGAEFLKWFDKLCRCIRKSYPTTFDGARVSPRVDALTTSGIELIGHRF